MVPTSGIEPLSTVLQTAAMTTSAKLVYMVRDERFELPTAVESGQHSTSELITLGVSDRYRSGTYCFTDSNAGHYTTDTIVGIAYGDRTRLTRLKA